MVTKHKKRITVFLGMSALLAFSASASAETTWQASFKPSTSTTISCKMIIQKPKRQTLKIIHAELYQGCKNSNSGIDPPEIWNPSLDSTTYYLMRDRLLGSPTKAPGRIQTNGIIFDNYIGTVYTNVVDPEGCSPLWTLYTFTSRYRGGFVVKDPSTGVRKYYDNIVLSSDALKVLSANRHCDGG